MDVELISPPFWNHPDSLAEIREVVSLLTRTYRINSKGNDSCGFHVHVSSRVSWNEYAKSSDLSIPQGLPAPTKYSGFHPRNLAKLVSLFWGFEDRIEMIHPKKRRGGESFSFYCEPLCAGSNLSRECNPKKKGWKREGVDKILSYDAKNDTKVVRGSKLDGLLRLLACREENNCSEICLLTAPQEERLSYNTVGLWLRFAGKRTVEYRGHEGTLDVEEVCNWIRVCKGLANFAEKVPDILLETFLRTHVDDKVEDYTVVDLLNDTGLPDEAEYYEKKIRELEEEEKEERNSGSISGAVRDSPSTVPPPSTVAAPLPHYHMSDSSGSSFSSSEGVPVITPPAEEDEWANVPEL